MIILRPEDGYVVERYQTVDTVNPITHQPAKMLAHKENGDCFYLGPNGCTIHGSAPVLCTGYDCGEQYREMTRAMRAMWRRNPDPNARAVIASGKRVWIERGCP